MQNERNHLNQPIGFALPQWQAPAWPSPEPMLGRCCRIEALDPQQHAADLFAANARDAEQRNWTYLPYGPFESPPDYRAWLEQVSAAADPQFHAIVDLNSGAAAGVAAYLRIQPTSGSIEVGHINLSPLLQRRPAATEAMYLMMARAFELGFRRYEWKCDALNAASRAAAQRLGLSYEGVFRQATVVKGRNRDTAWYALIDRDWPAVEDALRQWLKPENFDAAGQQVTRLSDLTAPLLVRRG